jgi:hypothetical protein
VAVGRRRVTQIRLVLREDSALAEDCDYDAYMESGYDWSLLKFNGTPPTVFTLRPLNHRAFSDILKQDESEKFVARCSLKRLQGYIDDRLDDMAGSVESGYLEIPSDAFEKDAQYGQMITADWWDNNGIVDRDQLLQLLAAASYISQAKRPLSSRSDRASGPDAAESKSEGMASQAA